MRALQAMFVALAAAVVLTSVASAGADADEAARADRHEDPPEEDVRARDAAVRSAQARLGDARAATGTRPSERSCRDGQEAFLWECRAWTFTGKRGTLVLRSQFAWIEAGGPYNIATGTWKVVRGTGQYAGVTGGGRSAQVGGPSGWVARYQGFLTSP